MKTACVCLLITLTTVYSSHADPSAEELLSASGIKGGIVVQLGCGDGKLTADLHASDRYLVHGLDTDVSHVEKAKTYIDSLSLYGKVSVETYDGKNLPYGDNIVNLIVMPNADCRVPIGELERVLTPRGVVLIKGSLPSPAATPAPRPSPLDPQPNTAPDGWNRYVKPVPTEIDDWTHYLHDASGNAVCDDKRVRRPRHTQWFAGPKRSRHHDALASMSAMTSSGGRLFYIFDEGSTSLMHRPPHWKLIARDAFNGKLLWKRDIPDWMTHLYNFRAGPKQLPRRLVSVGDNVYTTPGLCAPTEKIDGATGKTLLSYEGSKGTEELVLHNGMLLAVVGDPSILIDKSDGCFGYWEMAEYEKPTVEKSIAAYDAESGKQLWRANGENLKRIVPLSLCALGNNIFYLDNKELHCLDAQTGNPRWAAPFETQGLFMRAYAPTVVAHDDVILCLTWDRLCAYSIASGKKLWQNKGAMGFGSPGDLFAIGDKAWLFPMTKSIWRESRTTADGIVTTGIDIPKTNFLNNAETGVGVDIHSGKITDLLPFAHTQHHHRCYRNKATQQYILLGHSGIQVIDLATKANETHRWVRGLCQYGIMPANGYIYVPPDNCQCYSVGKINGFFALSDHDSWEDIEIAPALEKGPAYGSLNPQSPIRNPQSEDWPTYRGDNERSGCTRAALPQALNVEWSIDVGPTITAPVVADGCVFVADRDAYTVHCRGLEDGSGKWKYLANGPIDSPPTIYRGLCVFGCGDGSVYCLRADNGVLVWRFKTSGIERRIGYEDRLESPLHISGSVLVQDDTVYFAAGYSSNLDGGIRLYGLDVWTGEQRHAAKVASGDWGNDGQWGYLSDILVSDGDMIGMRSLRFDPALKKTKGRNLLTASTGLLEDSWFHRQGWTGGGGKGQLIVDDANRAVSVSSPYTGLKKRRKAQFRQFNQDGHLHQKFTRYEESFFPVGTTIASRAKRRGGADWSEDLKLQPRAMTLAGNQLCLAGWEDAVAVQMKTGRAISPGDPDPHNSVARVYAADTGKQLLQTRLDSEPVFDGMAVAQGKVFLSLKNGRLLCLGK